MGRLFKKHPLTIYRVETPDQTSLLSGERSYDQLQRVSFETIDETTIEKTFGAVTIENYRSPWFDPGNTEFGEYVAFSIRIDERKIPAAAFKRMVEDAIDDEKENAAADGRNFVSRDRKREIREQIRLNLLTQTVPSPAVADVWWNIKTGMLFLTDRSKAMKEALDDVFKGAFGTVYKLEEMVMGLNEEMDLVGKDFLTWIWTAGTLHMPHGGCTAVAYIDDRVHASDAQEVLKAEKIKGEDSEFDDIKRAVEEDGKDIIRALIRIEIEERFYEIEANAHLTPFLSISVPSITHHEEDGFEGALLHQIGNIEEAFHLFMKLLFRFELEQQGGKSKLRNVLRVNGITMDIEVDIETSDDEKVEAA